MKQLFGHLFVGLLAGLWLSLEEAQCQNLLTGIYTTSYCYNTSSGWTCFTTFHAANSDPVRKPFEEASRWCNAYVPGSNLIVINSQDSQRNVEGFIGKTLQNETIIMDARMLSTSKRSKWSWVNGHPYSPDVSTDARNTAEQFHDEACVMRHGLSLAYCFGNVTSRFGFICEYPVSSHNKHYVADIPDTWYEARKKCLVLGADLAYINDLGTTEDWSFLNETQRYWIGLRRNKWIWNSSGAALTYTNWNNGFPDETSDKQCICFSPQFSRENEARNDRKWSTCKCDDMYAIVCQKEEQILSSTSGDFKPSVSPSAYITIKLSSSSSSSTPSSAATKATTSSAISTTTAIGKKSKSSTVRIESTTATTVTTNKTSTTPTVATTSKTTSLLKTFAATTAAKEIATKTASTSSMTQEPSSHFSEQQTTVFLLSSSGIFNSIFNSIELLLILLLFLAIIFIIVAVILIIRKRRHDRRNQGSQKGNTEQGEAVSSAYATVVPANRLSEGTVPPGTTIYTDVEMTQQPTPPSSTTVDAGVQPTSEAVDMGKSIVYADVHFTQEHQQKSRRADKIAACLSSAECEPCEPPTSARDSLCRTVQAR